MTRAPVPPPSNETQSAWPSSEAIWSGVHGTPRTGRGRWRGAGAEEAADDGGVAVRRGDGSGADPSSFGWLTEAAPARDQQQLQHSTRPFLHAAYSGVSPA